jgi:hypothetical protein
MQVQKNVPAHYLQFLVRGAGQAFSEYFAFEFRGQVYRHLLPLPNNSVFIAAGGYYSN